MPTWLGIDIGSVNVKAAVVRATYRQGRARARRVLPRSSRGADGRRRPQRRRVCPRDVGERQAADASAVRHRRVARRHSHRLTLPAAAQKQLVDVLSYELEAQVPVDIEGAVFDWRLLEAALRRDRRRAAAAHRGRRRAGRGRARPHRARQGGHLARSPSAWASAPSRCPRSCLATWRRSPRTERWAVVDLGAKASGIRHPRGRRGRLRANPVHRHRGASRAPPSGSCAISA